MFQLPNYGVRLHRTRRNLHKERKLICIVRQSEPESIGSYFGFWSNKNRHSESKQWVGAIRYASKWNEICVRVCERALIYSICLPFIVGSPKANKVLCGALFRRLCTSSMHIECVPRVRDTETGLTRFVLTRICVICAYLSPLYLPLRSYFCGHFIYPFLLLGFCCRIKCHAKHI